MKLISDHIFAWEMFKLLNGADKKHATMLKAMEVLTDKEAENKKNVHVRGGCNFHFTAAKL